MPIELGLVHTPLTPFAADRQIDFEQYGWMIEFHLRHGAQALAVPMHVGESVSLTDEERRALIKFAVDCAGKRAPVVAHVSDAGTGIAAALARAAQDAGAAAVIATTPYYWTPPPAMILQHFVQIGAAVEIPFFVFNAPEDMAGSKINAALAVKLIEQRPNFCGVVDSSLDWQFMIELLTDAARVRPDFALSGGQRAARLGGSDRRARDVRAARGRSPDAHSPHVRSVPRAKFLRGARIAGGRRGAAPNPQSRRRRRAQSGGTRHGPRLRRSAPAAAAAHCRGGEKACGANRGAAGARARAAWLVNSIADFERPPRTSSCRVRHANVARIWS